jgi:hypothetical protein
MEPRNLETVHQRIAAGRKLLGERLFKLAITQIADASDHKAKKLIAECKGRKRVFKGKKLSIPNVLALMQDVARDHRKCQRHKRDQRAGWRHWNLGHYYSVGYCHPRTRTIRINYATPLRERMDSRIRTEVSHHLRMNYRINAHGNTEIHCNGPGVSFSNTDDYGYYTGAFKKYGKTHTDLTIGLQQNWWRDVYKEGLACCDNLLTLAAAPYASAGGTGHADLDDGTVLYLAIWLKQGQGYKYEQEQGWIAKKGNFTCHSTSRHPAGAIRGVRTKFNQEHRIRTHAVQEQIDGSSTVAFLKRLLAKDHAATNALKMAYPDLTCTVRDARNTGSCLPGIIHWCERTGLPYHDGEAPFFNVLQAHLDHPMPEAKLALLQALRRTFNRSKKRANTLLKETA